MNSNLFSDFFMASLIDLYDGQKVDTFFKNNNKIILRKL